MKAAAASAWNKGPNWQENGAPGVNIMGTRIIEKFPYAKLLVSLAPYHDVWLILLSEKAGAASAGTDGTLCTHWRSGEQSSRR